MEPIKFISPSSFFYLEKCPLKAIYSKEFRDQQIFPRHPDVDLGSVIHAFFENKTKWKIFSLSAFEEKWALEINKIDEAYKQSDFQNIYVPIKWHAKYFAVKKLMLRKSLLKEIKLPTSKFDKSIKFEKWIDDGKDIGGRVDFMILNENEEIEEIVDFKSGNIFEFKGKKKVIKMAYILQLALYAHIVKSKQLFYPKCYIQDIKGNKYEVEVIEEFVCEIYKRVLKLKTQINKCIVDNVIEQLANPNIENCVYCDYRPICKNYKYNFINNFDNKNVDIYGEVIEIEGSGELRLKIKIVNKIFILKGISTVEVINVGDSIFVYNLFCPDGDSQILFAMKQTLIKHG